MDIPKKTRAGKQRLVVIISALLLLGALGSAYARFNSVSGVTYVNRDDVVISEVVRGNLLREIRAPGNLVPAELRWVAATSNARVKEIMLDPGDAVSQDSVVMTLDNPDLEQALDSATLELEVLEAEFRAMEQRLHNEHLAQESVVAEFSARFEFAEFRMNANKQLLEDEVVSRIELNESILEERQLKTRYALEQRQLESLAALHEAELAAKRARINQSSRALQLQQKLYDELRVRTEFSGHLQDVPVEQGQQVAIGTILARVADNNSLKVELRVQESQVKDVMPGQAVTITAGGNAAKGTVRRVEPEVQQGVVTVDVYFDAEPLVGARSDLRVDGIIELERLDSVLKIQRPVFSQESVAVNLFVLEADGFTATQRLVRIGKTSTEEIEIIEGLTEGDRVIVSDTSQFNQLASFILQ
ncbi:MAG: HlyD family efflux transporter periplasmic adaptor subunit [Pseudomonadota bacterium]